MKVLLVHPAATWRSRLSTPLQADGHVVVTCAESAAAWEALTAFEAPEVALIALGGRGLDASALVSRLRAEQPEPHVYVVGLAPRAALPLVETPGVDEVFGLPARPDELRARVRAAGRIRALQEDLARARGALREQALRDPLTGLFNAPAVTEILERELSRAARARSPVSLLMFDIDHFRAVNDSYGVYVGDIVLREVASRARAALRPYDAVGRVGGEEFVVVLPGVGPERTGMLAERVRGALAANPVGLPDGRSVRVTVSVGAAGGDGGSVAGLFAAADAALRSAKGDGRNLVRLAPLPPSDRLDG